VFASSILTMMHLRSMIYT